MFSSSDTRGLRLLALVSVAVGALLTTCEAHSKEPVKPLTRLVEPLNPYPTKDAAAVAALSGLLARGDTVEYGGVIYECFGQYFVSVPVTQNLPHDLDYEAQNYNDCRIAATYHTHPTLSWTAEYFSKQDLKTLKALKATGYIGVIASGKIRKQTYNGPTQVVQFGPEKIQVSLGEEVPHE